MKLRYGIFTLIISLAFTIHALTVVAQDSDTRDRLSQVRDVIDNNELIMIWSQGDNQNEHYSYQRIYNLDMTISETGERLVPAEKQTDSVVTGNRQMAVAGGNFLGEEFKHIVAAWPGPDNTIEVRVPHINSGSLSWEEASSISITGPLMSVGSQKIQLTTGDFYGANRSDEFILAYQGADSTVHLQLFSFDSDNLNPIARGSINDEKVFMHDGTRHDNWDIVAGDFNGNGHHDIALLFVKPLGGNNWVITAKIYSVTEQGELIPEATQELFYRPYHVTTINISGTSGNFDNEPSEEIAMTFSFSNTENFGDDDTWLQILDIQDDLTSIIASQDSRIPVGTLNTNEMNPINIAAGDLNGDFREDIVIANSGSARIYTVGDQLIPEFRLNRPAADFQTNSHGNEDYFLAVGDMNGSGTAEIVTASNDLHNVPGGTQKLKILVISIDPTFSSSQILASRSNEEEISSDQGYRNFAIALGDFNGNRTWLGQPVHHRRTGILQPSVILHTPPIHYDILNSTIFDISNCFPNQGCGFSSTYIQSNTNAETITVEHHEDWGVSAGAELTLPGSKTKLEVTYGEKFSNSGTSTETMKISSGRTAAGDDWIFASVYDIDFYEYPIFQGQDPEPTGHFLVSVPHNIRSIWIEAKDDQQLGNNFRPGHEVGNILSYPSYDAEDRPDVANHIVDFQEQTVGATGESFVSLELSTFTENSAMESWEAGGSFEQTIGEGIDFYGLEAGFHVNWGGEYNRGEIITQTVSVNESLEMKADFGHLASQFGNSATYHIQPYAYWTDFGALAIDYKVDIPDGDNFWQDHYGGKTDLAFSLPWRYDLDKSFPLPGNDISYLHRTRDIALSDPEPQGGNTVTIGARVRNFGLQDVEIPVSVDFYLGDPLTDGVLIAEAVIDNIIPARGAHNVFVDWDIPVEVSLQDKRIYVLIDQNNEITNEVHDDNNMGWAPAFASGTSDVITGVRDNSDKPNQFVLHQSYPNPFNPTTTIGYELPQNTAIKLEVFNILGQRVATLVDGMQPAGTHNVRFDASSLASGMYLYRLTTESFSETKRMMLIK